MREDKIWTNIGFKIDRPGYLVDTITINYPTIIGVGHIFWVMEDSLAQKVQKELLSPKVNNRKSVIKYLKDSESAINDQNVFLIGSYMDYVHWDVVSKIFDDKTMFEFSSMLERQRWLDYSEMEILKGFEGVTIYMKRMDLPRQKFLLFLINAEMINDCSFYCGDGPSPVQYDFQVNNTLNTYVEYVYLLSE